MDFAAGVGGLLSLSITLCNGIVSYYQSWSSQEVSTSQALRCVSDLEETLKLFHATLTEISEAQNNAAPVNHLKVLQTHLEDGVQKLGHILNECRPNKPPKNKAERTRLIFKRAIYPFKTQTIEELQRTVETLKANLALGNDALQLHLTSNLFKRHDNIEQTLNALLAHSRKNETVLQSIETANASTHNRVDQVGTQLQRLQEVTLYTPTSMINNELPPAYTTITQLSNRSGSQADEISALTKLIEMSFSETFQEMANNRSSLGDTLSPANMLATMIIQKPSIHRAICSQTLEQSARMGLCKCRRRPWKKRQQRQLGFLSLFGEEQDISSHSRSCQFFNKSNKESLYGVRIGNLKSFLTTTVEIAFQHKAGAGGAAISLKMSIRSIFRPRSPTFSLLSKYFDTARREIPVEPSSVLKEIRRLYTSGQASPYDTDEVGRNALFIHSVMVPDAETWMLCMIKGLVEAGVPLLQTDCIGNTPLGYYLATRNFRELHVVRAVIKMFVSLGADFVWASAITSPADYYTNPNNWLPEDLYLDQPRVDWYGDLASDFEDMQVGSLGHAVFAQSITSVKAVMLSCPEALLHEKTVHNSTIVHLASNWTEGLVFILRNGGSALVNAIDDFGATPFDYAARSLNVDSMTALLKAGSIAFSEHHFTLFRWHSHSVSDLMKMEVEAMKIRRQALWAFAKAQLSPYFPAVSTKEILNTTFCQNTIDLLKENGLILPSYFTQAGFEFSILYGRSSLTSESAQFLWDNGFRDGLETYDSRYPGEQIFEQYVFRNIDMVEWLNSKPVHFYTPSHPDIDPAYNLTITKSHYIAYSMSPKYGPYSTVRNIQRNLATLRNLQFALSHEYPDCCTCACSGDGCTPFTLFLRECSECPLWIKPFGGPFHSTTKDLSTLNTFIMRDSPDLIHRFADQMIRVATFNAFGMTHTCCKSNIYSRSLRALGPRFSRTELEEIRHEERYLIMQFEEMVNTLKKLYQTTGLSISNFFHTVWKESMLKVMAKEPTINEEVLSGMRRVGVTIQGQSSQAVSEHSGEFWEDSDSSVLKQPTAYRCINFWLALLAPLDITDSGSKYDSDVPSEDDS